MKKIKLILADDHTILRDGLKTLLLTDPVFEIVTETDNGEDTVAQVVKYRPDMLILDINMPKLNGIEVIKKLREAKCKVKILVLSMFDDPKYVLDALSAGAEGYLNKMANMDEFFVAIKTILDGREYMNDMTSKALLSNLRKAPKTDQPGEGGQNAVLTSREIQIIKLIAEGFTSQEIAEQLFISYFTVSKHRKNILHKLNLKNTAELVNYCIRMGYTTAR